jgi:RNA polymerase sigma-70 factor (ECF subfamily)
MYVRKLVRNESLAQDVVQEVFIRAYERIDQLESGREIGPWLFRIAHNLSIDHLRKLRLSGDELPQEQASMMSDAEGAMITKQRHQQLQLKLGELRQEVREVLLLHYEQGMKVREIAEMVHLPLGTVLAHLSRGRQQLKNLMQEVGL